MALRAADVYPSEPRALLSQGDIYLAPSVVIWSALTHPVPAVIPPAPASPGESALVLAWVKTAASSEHVPEITLATSWTPVLVLSHDCEIDKEFNEYVDWLIDQGDSEEAAVREAEERSDLDRYIVVSPLLPYDERVVSPGKFEAIRSAQKIGYFPLPPMPAYSGAEFLVHLSRTTTVERILLSRRYKIGSLSDLARQLLRFKLAEVLASRSLAAVSKLEVAIGQRITDVRTLKVKRSDATVVLVLEDGAELHVGAKTNRESAAPERTRRSEAE
ncbi:hypothetical protein BH20GEM2_BH20GEM2_03070 [soil metagenome]